jgi:hypothetical protein
LPKGERQDTAATSPSPQPSYGPPSVPPHPTHLTAATRKQFRSTIGLFVSSSVARHHPERSWAIVHPVLREGLTKRQWSTGEIPVVPYPAAGVDLIKVESLTDRRALIEVFLEPARNAHLVRKTFQIELTRRAGAPNGWLVSSWVPEGVSQSQIDLNDQATTPASVVAAASHPPRISSKWIFVFLGILVGALVLVPTGLFAREAYQYRRAKAEFHRSRVDRTDLSG